MQPVATTWFFYGFAAVAIISGLMVITRRNPVHSAISLVFTLLSIAGLYLMLYAPFVAGVQIILYVGGIMVLFLFVIMLVNIDRNLRGTVQQAVAGGDDCGSGPGRLVQLRLPARAEIVPG